MAHPFLSFDRVAAIAHRGGAKVRPENTIVAFDGALAEQVDGFELDVRLSRDGDVVVIHDETLDRTTNVSGAVAALTADELARVDAGYRFADGDRFPFRGQGVGIPCLRDVLMRYRNTPIVVELKGQSRELAERTAEIIRQTDAVDRVIIGGFDSETMAEARLRLPSVPTGASTKEVRRALYYSYVGMSAKPGGYELFQVPEWRGPTRVVSPRFVRAATRVGIPVQVWVVNEEADMRRLIEWGVRGLISDRPATAVGVARTAAFA